MKQRLRFGDKSLRLTPRFGRHCVCCNADAQGRHQIDEAGTAIPVCVACQGHALRTPLAPLLQAIALLIGGAFTTSGAIHAAHDMLTVGISLIVLAVAWMRWSSRRRQRAVGAGHHPGLALSFVTATFLDTDNDTLVDELLALNPLAQRVPTPLLWRLRGEGMPQAKVVKRTD